MTTDVPPPAASPWTLAAPPAWELVAEGYADENVDHFTRYAEDAVRLARVGPGTRVVDIAAGPGTLSFVAVRAGAVRVAALDFSSAMLAHLRARATREGITQIEAREGDGQALPYADASFDAAFSMFGLMFFPDRARGFAEMRRVLVPGGRAVVSAWQPIAQAPFLTTLVAAMFEQLPGATPPPPGGPLTDPDEFAAELRAAGFRDVAIEPVVHANEWPDMATCCKSIARSFAPLVLLRQRMGDAAADKIGAHIHARLEEKFGPGLQRVPMPAWLGMGTA